MEATATADMRIEKPAIREPKMGDVVRYSETDLGFPDDLRAYPAIVICAYPESVCDLKVLRLYDEVGAERVEFSPTLAAGKWSW